jgi:hypothetical protein
VKLPNTRLLRGANRLIAIIPSEYEKQARFQFVNVFHPTKDNIYEINNDISAMS